MDKLCLTGVSVKCKGQNHYTYVEQTMYKNIIQT